MKRPTSNSTSRKTNADSKASSQRLESPEGNAASYGGGEMAASTLSLARQTSGEIDDVGYGKDGFNDPQEEMEAHVMAGYLMALSSKNKSVRRDVDRLVSLMTGPLHAAHTARIGVAFERLTHVMSDPWEGWGRLSTYQMAYAVLYAAMPRKPDDGQVQAADIPTRLALYAALPRQPSDEQVRAANAVVEVFFDRFP
jgi:hypothetical protein